MAFESGKKPRSAVPVKKETVRTYEQGDLFEGMDMPAPTTTAIYPNRMRDKWVVEKEKGLAEAGNGSTKFFTSAGTLLAEGYERIVYGDHGPYIEFSSVHIRAALVPKFPGRVLPEEAYYEWLEPSDGSEVKVYDQKRDVKHLKNPPPGGFQGNRKEGYADYRPGMLYVSPFEVDAVRS